VPVEVVGCGLVRHQAGRGPQWLPIRARGPDRAVAAAGVVIRAGGAANWKIVAEGFLEGYHLNALHPDTFFPIQFDNLNVIERFGPNSRVTFPYRRIDRLREVPAKDRSADGVLTYVYHLFPNAMLVTFSKNTTLIVLEPVAVDRTRLVNYTLTHRDPGKADQEALARDLQFIEAGTAQDRDAACAIQRSLQAGANDFFEFGLFESAIVHFHRTLRAAIEGVGRLTGRRNARSPCQSIAKPSLPGRAGVQASARWRSDAQLGRQSERVQVGDFAGKRGRGPCCADDGHATCASNPPSLITAPPASGRSSSRPPKPESRARLLTTSHPARRSFTSHRQLSGGSGSQRRPPRCRTVKVCAATRPAVSIPIPDQTQGLADGGQTRGSIETCRTSSATTRTKRERSSIERDRASAGQTPNGCRGSDRFIQQRQVEVEMLRSVRAGRQFGDDVAGGSRADAVPSHPSLLARSAPLRGPRPVWVGERSAASRQSVGQVPRAWLSDELEAPSDRSAVWARTQRDCCAATSIEDASANASATAPAGGPQRGGAACDRSVGRQGSATVSRADCVSNGRID
jgi:hypothetical protein